ncbi:MAG: hypothetical protein R2827_01665 [Bdellovibrionales bacterium]
MDAIEARAIVKFVNQYENAANEVVKVAEDSTLDRIKSFLRQRVNSF